MVVLLAVVVIGGVVWLVRRIQLNAPRARARTARARTAPGRVSLAGRSAESGSRPR